MATCLQRQDYEQENLLLFTFFTFIHLILTKTKANSVIYLKMKIQTMIENYIKLCPIFHSRRDMKLLTFLFYFYIYAPQGLPGLVLLSMAHVCKIGTFSGFRGAFWKSRQKRLIIYWWPPENSALKKNRSSQFQMPMSLRCHNQN